VNDRERLRRRLLDAGQTDEVIDRATDEGRLGTLAVELAVFGDEQHTLTAVARAARLPSDYVRELLQAAGRPNPRRGERVFCDDDIAFARLTRRLIDAGLPRAGLVDVARTVSHGTALAAEAVRQLVGDALLRAGDSEHAAGLRFAEAADDLSPLVPELFGYHFRAHLRDSVRRALLSATELEAGRLDGSGVVAVAFADLVGYTRASEERGPSEIGALAGELTRLATKSTEPPVQLAKMIGDAAMFVSDDATALVATCLRLRDAVEDSGPDFPTIRIGAGYGMAMHQGGDWFGSAVNLASRITDLAKPGQILVSEDLSSAAPDHGWTRRRKRSLKGFDGRVRLLSLESE
jgi:adenylate cyclase